MSLRTVVFNRFIHAVYEYVDDRRVLKNGTNCWQTDYPNTGLFHQWGSICEESDNGIATSTVALIELPDGTIEEVFPSRLKFVIPSR